MPVLVVPAFPAGILRDLEQPRLTVDEELVLRPWRAADASMVQTGFSYEGTLRQAIQHADGFHDWHIHGRLQADD